MSDRLFDWWTDVVLAGNDLAERLPTRVLRFVGLVVLGLGWFLLLLPLSFCVMVVTMVLSVWEEAGR